MRFLLRARGLKLPAKHGTSGGPQYDKTPSFTTPVPAVEIGVIKSRSLLATVLTLDYFKLLIVHGNISHVI